MNCFESAFKHLHMGDWSDLERTKCTINGHLKALARDGDDLGFGAAWSLYNSSSFIAACEMTKQPWIKACNHN